MAFDFSKLKAPTKEQRPTDPIAIFQGLRVTDPTIKDLWLAQGDALRGWNEKRNEKDVAISLNTGAGKTLVGLLIGQSLVNEMRSLVLYTCSSLQLVEQTAKKAQGCYRRLPPSWWRSISSDSISQTAQIQVRK